MDSLPISMEELQRLIALFDRHRLAELELKESGWRVRLAVSPERAAVEASVEEAVDTGFPEPAGSLEPSPEERGWVAIHAPMTGSFYASPAPDEPNFVEVGGTVEVDQIVGLIEAMKIYSEIHSEIAGTLVELPVSNGQTVQAGQVLAWVAPG